MAIVAPEYECDELLARYGRKKIPIAAWTLTDAFGALQKGPFAYSRSISDVPFVPDPEVVEEILGLADQAKNEPEFKLPAYVLNLLENEEVMAIVAPEYEFDELLARYDRKKVPIAA